MIDSFIECPINLFDPVKHDMIEKLSIFFSYHPFSFLLPWRWILIFGLKLWAIFHFYLIYPLIQIRYVSNWFYIGHRYSAKNSPNQGCRLIYGLSWNKMLTVGALCSLWKISLGDLKNISSNFASVTNVCLSEPLSYRINPADQETLYFSKFLHGFVKTSWSKCSFPAFISEVDTNHIFQICQNWYMYFSKLIEEFSSKFASVRNVCLSVPLSSWINPADETLVIKKVITSLWCQKIIWPILQMVDENVWRLSNWQKKLFFNLWNKMTIEKHPGQ